MTPSARPILRAAGYVRVSTAEQSAGLSLQGQRRAVLEEIARRGWEAADVVADTGTGTNTRRPGLQALLARLAAGDLDCLVIARLDRLSRSTGDFYMLMDRAQREGWSIICLSPQVDMTSPFGRAMAGMAAIFAQLESELIGQRQRDSVAERRAAGTYRPAGSAVSPVTEATARRVVELRGAPHNLGLRRIAERLALEGYAPPRGTRWHTSTVKRILDRA